MADQLQQIDRSGDVERDSALDEAEPWVEPLARLGYAAKGVVYMLIGVLALQAAFGPGGKTTGAGGALRTIVDEPFGQLMLAVIAVGLVGYVLWRLVQAFLDPEDNGTDPKGLARRAAYLVSGLAYATVALTAGQLVFGAAGGSNDNQQEVWVARILSLPFGAWLVGLGGLLLIGGGLGQLYRAYEAEFADKWKSDELSSEQQSWATKLGRFGLAARGVVYGILGVFLIRAALQYDPSEAGGLGEALSALVQQPFGPWLLALVALGLASYGVYALLRARYRQLELG